jgi:hypothetical protein
MTTEEDAKKILAAIILPKVEEKLEKDKTTNKEADQINYEDED